MKVLGVTFSLMFLLTSALTSGQRGAPAPANPSEEPALCKLGSLPADIQNRLKWEFGSWKIQEPSNLSPRARERWESEKPLQCPGIAVGLFENAKKPSYAVLLVPKGHTGAGYKFVVFSPKAGQPSHEMRLVEQSDGSGAANFFIRRMRISKFFDEHSKKKFQVQTSEGILLVDAAENEYETDVYFWTNGSYQHQPVDY